MAEEKSLMSKALDLAFDMPLTIIDRQEFLTANFRTRFDAKTVATIVDTSPIKANVDKGILNRIAKDSIKYERTCATATSAASGLPGGWTMIPATMADAAQFLSHEIRLIQKIAYLFGYPDFRTPEGCFDETSKNVIICFLGVMYQVKGASLLIKDIAAHLAEKTVKDIGSAALTKTAWYPILKKIAEMFGYKLTKDGLAKFLGKAIPLIGAGISGGVTYVTFTKQSKRLLEVFSENPVR